MRRRGEGRVNGGRVVASLMLLAGALGDRFGRKRVMIVGIVIFLIGSVIGAIADSSNTLIIGRAVMGVGAAASEPAMESGINALIMSRAMSPFPRGNI